MSVKPDLSLWLSKPHDKALSIANRISRAQAACASNFTSDNECMLMVEGVDIYIDELRSDLTEVIKLARLLQRE